MGIKTKTDFDQIFREKLQDHEVTPPDFVWSNIQASGLNASASTSFKWRVWAAASAIAFILASSAYLFFSDDSETIETPNTQPELVKEDISTPAIETKVEISETTHDLVVNKEEEAIVNISQNEIEDNIHQEIKNINEMVFEEDVNSSEQNTNKDISIEETRLMTPNKLIPSELMVEGGQVEKDNLEEIASNEKASKAGYDFFDDDAIDDMTAGHLNEKFWELGIEFSPEWITIPDNSNNIKSYGLDISAKYYIGNWFVESGIGGAFSKDEGIYRVDTLSIFKGSYEDVFNVTFDTASGIPVPTYFTKTVNVYENIDTNYVSKTKNSYAYINIPISFGYSKKLGEKFTIYAKTGLIASFKIYENIPEIETNNGTTIVKQTPLYFDRSAWHLQAQLNLGIDYHITNKFIFGLEPNARYYIKSLVENNNGGNPYGLGVKIGFKYLLK